MNKPPIKWGGKTIYDRAEPSPVTGDEIVSDNFPIIGANRVGNLPTAEIIDESNHRFRVSVEKSNDVTEASDSDGSMETAIVPYQTVQYENTVLSIQEAGGQRLLSSLEMGMALGYKRADSLGQLIRNNPKEFEGKTCTIKIMVQGQRRDVVFLNRKGVIMAAMMAKTPKASDFRIWAVNVLDELMTVGEVRLVDHPLPGPVDIEHQKYLENMRVWNQLWNDHPESAPWIMPRIDQFTQRELARTQLPIIGVTRLDEDIFKRLVLGQNWSPSTMQRAFRMDIASKKEYDELCRKWGVPKWKTVPVPEPVMMKMFRDFYQVSSPLVSDMDDVILKYIRYSRESIRRGLNKMYAHFTKTLAENQDPHVDRWSKAAYAAYLASVIWDIKRHLYLYPTGPFDQCWICGDHISLSTGHLHHVTYDRVGYEIFEDLWPLCPVCHRFVHKLDTVPQDVLIPGVVSTSKPTVMLPGQTANFAVVPEARIVEITKGGAFKIALPNGAFTHIPKTVVHPDSEIQKVGQHGTLVCIMRGLWDHVRVALEPWGQEKI